MHAKQHNYCHLNFLFTCNVQNLFKKCIYLPVYAEYIIYKKIESINSMQSRKLCLVCYSLVCSGPRTLRRVCSKRNSIEVSKLQQIQCWMWTVFESQHWFIGNKLGFVCYQLRILYHYYMYFGLCLYKVGINCYSRTEESLYTTLTRR